MEGDLVDLHIDLEAGVLDGVGGEVLHRGHGVALDPSRQRRAHLANVVRILAIGLLGTAPGRVTQQVDAHAAEERGTHGTQLDADGVTDPLLEIDVEGGSPRHRHGEGSRTIDDHAAGSVGEGEAGDAQPRHLSAREAAQVVAQVPELVQAGPEGPITIETAEPLLGCHRSDELGRSLLRVEPVLDGGKSLGEVHGVIFALRRSPSLSARSACLVEEPGQAGDEPGVLWRCREGG